MSNYQTKKIRKIRKSDLFTEEVKKQYESDSEKYIKETEKENENLKAQIRSNAERYNNKGLQDLIFQIV